MSNRIGLRLPTASALPAVSASNAPGLLDALGKLRVGLQLGNPLGLSAPAGTPEGILGKLNRLLNEVLKDPDVIERFESHGAPVEPGTPDALLSKARAELARWSKVVKQARLAPSESRLATLD